MSFQDEEDLFGLITGGCPLHGDDAMAECPVCGAEFCRRCHPGATECPECAGQPEGDAFFDEGVVGPDEAPEDEEDEADRLLREAQVLDFDETLQKELEEEDLESTMEPPSAEENPSESPDVGPRARPSKTGRKPGARRGGKAGGRSTGSRTSKPQTKGEGKPPRPTSKKSKPKRRSR